MTTQQEKYAEMKLMLQEGLEILTNASEQDRYMLNQAILKIHGALEEFVRLEVARKAPELRMRVEDPQQTTWNDLIGYGKQYLGFTENDARTITRANRWRQPAAHGRNLDASLNELKTYANFVQRWCGQVQTFQVNDRVTEDNKPKHQSTLYQPVRSSSGLGCFGKFVVFVILLILCSGAGFVIWMGSGPGGFEEMFRQMSVPSSSPNGPTKAPTVSASDPILATIVATIVDETNVNETNTACNIEWTEYKLSDLAGKNRSTVWEELVMQQVQGSGMTDRQFYDLVVEKNPELITDGYEFKRGKTYRLPACQ